jgi:hypothetical protein
VDEQLEDAIIALAPVYRLVAWSRDNDRIALDRRIESVEEERARTHAEHAAETERWRAEQAEARRRSAEQGKARGAAGQPFLPAARAAFAKKPTLDALFAKPAPAAPPRATNAPAHATAKDLPAEAKDAPAREVVKEMVKEVASLAPSTMEKGAKVRVLSGPFADKVGVIGELDGRGGARVLLGLLSTRVDVAGLEPVVEGRERPPLHSSHRRPLAPAPRRAR